MKTESLLNYTQRQLERMTEKELRQTVSTLRSTSRKRYERIVEADVYSQSAQALWRASGGNDIFPTIKGMDATSLLNEYKRYVSFLKSKTSTVRGAKKSTSQSKQLVEDLSGGKEFTDEETTEIFLLADELKNEINLLQSSTDRISAISEVYNPNLTKKEIMEKAREIMVNRYEEQHPTTPLAVLPSKAIK